ncbi:MAG: CHASE4 domain-containing protein [Planctomycetota bacterium]
MKIASKLQIALSLLFIAIAAGNYVILQEFVQAESSRLDESDARDDVERCQEAVHREIRHLSILARDWSCWDDTCAFLESRDPAYLKSNLTDEAFHTSAFHLFYLLGPTGDVVWSGVRAPDYRTPLHLDRLPIQKLRLDDDAVGTDSEPSERSLELIATQYEWPLLLCARPVLPSEAIGRPRGTLIMGRFLHDEAVADLQAQTRVNFQLHALHRGIPSWLTDTALQLPTPDSITVGPGSAGTVVACGYIKASVDDWSPQLLVTINRAVRRQGALVARFSMFILAAAAVVTCGLLFTLLRKLILGPLEQMTAKAVQIGHTGDLTQRIGFHRRADEIGVLAREFDGMIERLGETRAKLLETSRAAGMTDVAVGVLHNLGNVLNSVNVSTIALAERLQRSQIAGLKKLSELLHAHRGDLARFLTNDDRGRNVPEYLQQLSSALHDEHRSALVELRQLKTSIDHMNQVVQSQHAFTSRSSHREPTDLRQLVANALTIMEAALQRHGIHISADLAQTPMVEMDAAKCLQLVINLISNAKDALGAQSKGDKELRVRLSNQDDEHALIEVADNGVGIAPENLPLLFRNGFTTKSRGRGFGLHYSALAARELGGELTAHSDGPGQGARFRLSLPLANVLEAAT